MSRHSDTILERILLDYHSDSCVWPGTTQAHDVAHLRGILGAAAGDLVRICPQSRELNHALNKLDEASSWAQRSIERHRGCADDGD